MASGCKWLPIFFLALISSYASDVPSSEAVGKKIAHVSVWGVKTPASLSAKEGEVLTEKTINDDYAALVKAAPAAQAKSSDIVWPTARFEKNVDGTVDVHYYVIIGGFSLVKGGDPIVNVPVFPLASLLPEEINQYSPAVSVFKDQSYGWGQASSLQTSWQLNDASKGAKADPRMADRLWFSLSGKNSFEHDYNDERGEITLSSTPAGGSNSSAASTWGFSFEHKEEPLASNRFSSTGGNVDKRYRFEVGDSPLNIVDVRVALGEAAIRQASINSNETASLVGARYSTRKLQTEWAAYGVVAPSGESTNGAAVSSSGGIRWAQDFLMSDSRRCAYFSADATLTGGTLNGDTVPWDHRQFYGVGGVNLTTSDPLKDSPAFPVRSLGQGDGVVRGPGGTSSGCTSFVGISSNLAIPIPFLSAPLIPNAEVVDPDTGEKIPVSKVIENNLPEMWASQFKDPSWTAEQKKEIRDYERNRIRPLANYLGEYADLYYVKPLFMLDAGWAGAPYGFEDRWLMATGGGIELGVANIGIQVGYIRTVIDSSGGNREGNLIAAIRYKAIF